MNGPKEAFSQQNRKLSSGLRSHFKINRNDIDEYVASISFVE